ncbi:hypothetical protein BJ742DRAFT_767884 [Cladochytrium replicatum]|nr:hypothetical protein BJ742DRAFT_767884 [Cladochytrium replicatum]
MDMGIVAQSQGELAKAMQLCEESVVIRVSIYDTGEHIEVAQTLMNIGSVTNHKAIMELYEEFLHITVRVYGTRDHVEVAQTPRDGESCRFESDLSKAMNLYEDRLPSKLGYVARVSMQRFPKHALIADQLGEYARAMELYVQSFVIKVWYQQNASVDQTAVNMGTVAEAQGELAKSKAVV